MEVQTREIEPIRVAAMRHVGPYTQIGPVFQQLCAWAGPRGVFGPGTIMLGLYHDDPSTVPEDQLRSDACVSVGPEFASEPGDGVEVIELAGGPYAVYTHVGPYEGLADAWKRFFCEWLPSSGLRPARQPCCEVYLNDPTQVPPEKLRTEIRVPLETA